MEFRTLDQTLSEGNTVVGKAIAFDSPSKDLGFIETIKRGAITQELLDESDVFARMNHSEDYILARWNKGKGSLNLELRDDGLYFDFEIPNTEKGNELREHIKRGEISQCSFAFVVSSDDNAERWYKKNGVTYREINKIGWLGDVAPVFNPAYEDTIVSLRAKQMVEKLNTEDEEENAKEDEQNDKPTEVEDETKPNEQSDNKEEEAKDNPTEEEKPKKDEEKYNKEEEPEEEKDKSESDKRTINSKTQTNMEFRLIKAINDIANNRNLDETAQAVVGRGIEEMRKSGLSYGGQIQLPVSELRDAITVTTEGEDVVATDIYDILEPLRAKNVLVNAGAKFLSGLVGDVQIPSMTGANVTWEGENVEAKDGAGTFTSVKLQPKRLTAYIDISKNFLIQTDASSESLIRQDLINAINSKLEATILGEAAGTVTQPKGIFEGVTKTITSFADLCDLESDVEDANVMGECKYIMSNKAKAAFRNMSKSTKSTELVMQNGEIDGTQVFNTSNVTGKNVAFGDFSNLAIGQWGSIDLTVDPYTLATKGMIRLVINAYFDSKVLRESAIVTAKVQ